MGRCTTVAAIRWLDIYPHSIEVWSGKAGEEVSRLKHSSTPYYGCSTLTLDC
jgi:hypothetical protein